MRERESIERDMYRAREDLESSLAELRHVVQEKVDVKARARVAVEKGKLMAADAYERGKHAAKEYAIRGKDNAQRYFERGKESARQLASRGKEGAHELVQRGEDRVYDTYRKAKDRPLLTALVIASILATGIFVFVASRKHWWRRPPPSKRSLRSVLFAPC